MQRLLFQLGLRQPHGQPIGHRRAPELRLWVLYGNDGCRPDAGFSSAAAPAAVAGFAAATERARAASAWTAAFRHDDSTVHQLLAGARRRIRRLRGYCAAWNKPRCKHMSVCRHCRRDLHRTNGAGRARIVWKHSSNEYDSPGLQRLQLHFGLRQPDYGPAGHRGASEVRAYGNHHMHGYHGCCAIEHLIGVAASAFASWGAAIAASAFASWGAAIATSAVADQQNTSATAIATTAQLSPPATATALRFAAQLSAFMRALLEPRAATAVLRHAVRGSDSHGRHVLLQQRQRHHAAEHDFRNNRF